MMKGSYILVVFLDSNKKLSIGKLGKLPFKKGFYVYVGSAMNNLDKRVARHLEKDKNIHWHIDYFLQTANVVDFKLFPSQKKEECSIAQKLAVLSDYSIPSFGCSDCKCFSHLFYFKNLEKEKILYNIYNIK